MSKEINGEWAISLKHAMDITSTRIRSGNSSRINDVEVLYSIEVNLNIFVIFFGVEETSI